MASRERDRKKRTQHFISLTLFVVLHVVRTGNRGPVDERRSSLAYPHKAMFLGFFFFGPALSLSRILWLLTRRKRSSLFDGGFFTHNLREDKRFPEVLATKLAIMKWE